MRMFGGVVSKIYRFVVSLRNSWQSLSALNETRAANPTCVIKGSGLIDVELGKYVTILDGVYLGKVILNDFSYVSNISCIVNASIGKFCSIGPHIQIGLAPHPVSKFVSTYPAFYSNSNSGCALNFRDDKIFDDSVPETVIGNDVWIGANVIVPGGISIGTGAIIAAGAVVTKDVPPYAVVGGNPAKIIRYRFSEDEIEALLKSEWWDWPVEDIKSRIDIFSDINIFLKSAKK